MVHVRNSQGRIYMLLVFTLFGWSSLYIFVTDSKGNNDIIDVKKMWDIQQIAPSLKNKRKYFF